MSANFKPNKQSSQLFIKHTFYSITVILVFTFLFVLFGEIVTRLFSGNKYKYNSPAPPFNTAQKDELLGWKMTPNYSFEGIVKDEFWNDYPISIHFDENGFKEYGNVNSDKSKIFFIGDSFTASVEVSNKNTFYRIIQDSLDFELFAYGHPGYGTLQEYLFLDKWIDIIAPDLIVWGVCSNDVIDNYAPLEKKCGYKVSQRRPYLNSESEIYYETALTTWQRIKRNIHFFAWMEDSFYTTREKITGEKRKFGEHYIFKDKRGFKEFDDAVKTTEKIVERIKSRIPDSIKVIGFSVDNYDPHISEFSRIFKQNGFHFTRDASNAIDKKKYYNENVKALGGVHWNEYGQQVVADALIPILKEHLNQ